MTCLNYGEWLRTSPGAEKYRRALTLVDQMPETLEATTMMTLYSAVYQETKRAYKRYLETGDG